MPRRARDRILLVARLADELQTHPIYASPTKSSVTITFEGGRLTTATDESDEHLLKSLFVRLRPFLLGDDDVAIRHINDPQLVHAIELGKNGYRQARRSFGLQHIVNGREITPERAADLYLNGVMFHHDAEKEAELAEQVEVAAVLTR